MAENSKIEWTTHTFNPWVGCSKVSAGCANCYAEALMDHRWGKVEWGDRGERKKTSDANWRMPYRWDDAARDADDRHRVFCASLADVFEDRPEVAPWRRELFRLIDSTFCLDWLLLTKRPENIPDMWRNNLGDPDVSRRSNVWLGTSVENQETADLRIPLLLDCREFVPVLFVSYEPALAPVDFSPWMRRNSYEAWASGGGPRECGHGIASGLPCYECRRIDWLIMGGESGPGARPMSADWVRSTRDQCVAGGVHFFFKQWGTFGADGSRASKQKNGREIDARFWDEVPYEAVF